MKNTATSINLVKITSALLLISLSTLTSHLAEATPRPENTSWKAYLGYEYDFGSTRDPGDRDGAMAGSASGPSVGVQWWHSEWFAVESSFLYQSQEGKTTHDYDQTAWRLGTGARFTYPSMISPHITLGLAYDHFESEWTLPSDGNRSNGSGVDQLNGLAGTAEMGLSFSYLNWTLSGHLGFLAYLATTQQESTVNTWTEGTEGSITRESHTNWANNDLMPMSINFGLRLAYGF